LALLEKLYAEFAPWLLSVIELALVIASVALIFLSRRKLPLFLSWNIPFCRLARRKNLAVFAMGTITLAVRVLLIPVWGVPQPAWHDEFSHLLAADTFAHGRLTNPPHPMWIHFEGFHIIQQPTYMSMYPPGQGIILAAGQLLGNPWIGQLLATALMCACLCWMLQAWVPAHWALLGAILAVLHLALLSYWMNSYFGTSLPALAGMLVLGAWPRIEKHLRVRDSVLLGVGLIILANTRPYEGMVFSLPIGVALVRLISRKKIHLGRLVQRVILPLFLILAAGAIATGYYFWRVTGNPFVMPYQVNRQTYAVAPYFIWESPRPEPMYRHAEMRDFYVNWELRSYQAGTTLAGFALRLARRAGMLWEFFVGPVFTLPLLALPWLFADRKMRLPLIMAGVVIAGNVVETWTLIHYLAPAVGLFFLLLTQSLRHLRLSKFRARPVGQALARAVVAICIAMVVLRVTAMAASIPIEPPQQEGNQKRDTIIRQLQNLPGKQLVIVHYGPHHIPHQDWINNRADIDTAKIVWARDMGDQQNRELLAYFKDRRTWRMNADEPAIELQALSADRAQK
jgi:hypothetical protein